MYNRNYKRPYERIIYEVEGMDRELMISYLILQVRKILFTKRWILKISSIYLERNRLKAIIRLLLKNT